MGPGPAGSRGGTSALLRWDSAPERRANVADPADEVRPAGVGDGQGLLQPTLRTVFRRMVEGLEHHVVTGEIIGKDGVPAAG